MADAGIIGPESRVELINGEIFDMSPIGSLHAAVVSRLARDFIVAVGEAAVYAGAGIREYWVVDLSSRSIAILSDPRDGTYETRRTHRGGEPLEPAGLPGCLVDPLAMLRRL